MKLAVALLVLVACEARSAPPVAAPTAESPPPPPAEPAPTLSVDDVRPIVLVPVDARLVTRHAVDLDRDRVTVSYCFDDTALDAAAQRVVDKLRDRGWAIDLSAASDAQPRRRLAGRHEGHLLEGIVQRGPWAQCRADRGQTFVSLSIRSASGT